MNALRIPRCQPCDCSCFGIIKTSGLGTTGEGLPLLVDLVGFSESGLSRTNWVGFRENLPERLDRLIAEERMSPVLVAFRPSTPRRRATVYRAGCPGGQIVLLDG
jgi:hypothetical protein